MNQKTLNVTVYKIPEELGYLKRVSGIYFLMHEGEIDYIGKSTNINSRLMGHRVFNRQYHDEVWVYPMDFRKDYLMYDLEYQLIRQYNPPSNTHGKVSHG